MHGAELMDPEFLVQSRGLAGLGPSKLSSPSFGHPPYSRKKGLWHIARIVLQFLEEPVAKSAPCPRPSSPTTHLHPALPAWPDREGCSELEGLEGGEESGGWPSEPAGRFEPEDQQRPPVYPLTPLSR